MHVDENGLTSEDHATQEARRMVLDMHKRLPRVHETWCQKVRRRWRALMFLCFGREDAP